MNCDGCLAAPRDAAGSSGAEPESAGPGTPETRAPGAEARAPGVELHPAASAATASMAAAASAQRTWPHLRVMPFGRRRVPGWFRSTAPGVLAALAAWLAARAA